MNNPLQTLPKGDQNIASDKSDSSSTASFFHHQVGSPLPSISPLLKKSAKLIVGKHKKILKLSRAHHFFWLHNLQELTANKKYSIN